MDVLVFELDERAYALPVERVEEVVRAVAITPLPGAPEIVEGVIRVRGRVVPVLDVRARFGHARRPLHPDHHLILANAEGRVLALRIDRCRGLETLEPERLDPLARSGSTPYVAGVARSERGLVVIHDLDTFLAESEAAALDLAVEERA